MSIALQLIGEEFDKLYKFKKIKVLSAIGWIPYLLYRNRENRLHQHIDEVCSSFLKRDKETGFETTNLSPSLRKLLLNRGTVYWYLLPFIQRTWHLRNFIQLWTLTVNCSSFPSISVTVQTMFFPFISGISLAG